MKFEKKVIISIIVISIIILFGSLYVESTRKKEQKNDNDILNKSVTYQLHYHTNIYYYDILLKTGKDSTTYITLYEEVDCYMEPCNPIKVDEYIKNISDEEELVFIKLFNKNETEKTISSYELTDYQTYILKEIVSKEDNDSYSIYYDKRTSGDYKKGYSLKENKLGGTSVIISNGAKPNSEYGIEVASIVEQSNGDIYIYVKDKIPSSNDMALQVITYPIATIEFDYKIKNIKVFDENNNEYKLVDNNL